SPDPRASEPRDPPETWRRSRTRNPQERPARTRGASSRRLRLIRRAQRLDVRGQRPDVAVRQPRAPRRHSVRAPFGDGIEDLPGRFPVQPDLIAEARPHPGAAVTAMAALAVVLA